MTQIDYYFSTISPFTYLAGLRLEETAQRNGATIAYKPVDVIALFARTGGTPPGQRHESRQSYRLQEIRRQAAKAGLPVNLKPMFFPANAAPASYAIIAAQSAGGGDVGALVHDVLSACWAKDMDVADDAVIRACLQNAGFDPALADSGLLVGAETYGANLEEAVERGVFGTPFYIVGDEKFWGQDRLDDLDLFLQGKL